VSNVVRMVQGESCIEVETKADSNNITEHPHHMTSQDHIRVQCVTNGLQRKESLNKHRLRHIGEKLPVYSCAQCEKCFSTLQSLRTHL